MQGQSHGALMLWQQTSWLCPDTAQAMTAGRLPDGPAVDVLHCSFLELSLTRCTSRAAQKQLPLGICICNVHLVTECLTPGLLQVAHKIHTLRVELYENASDYVRLTLEVLLTLGIGYTVFIEFKAIFMTHMKTVSLPGAPNVFSLQAATDSAVTSCKQRYHILMSAVTSCMKHFSSRSSGSDSTLLCCGHHHQRVLPAQGSSGVVPGTCKHPQIGLPCKHPLHLLQHSCLHSPGCPACLQGWGLDYFRSSWHVVDFLSVGLMVVCIIIWWEFVIRDAIPFDIQLR